MITLKTLPQAIEQEVFDQVARHLLTQMSRSLHDSNICAYRSDLSKNALKCAAGCLIDDDEYNDELEGKSWDTLASKNIVPIEHSQLIRELQLVHDGSNPDKWHRALELIAKSRGLKMVDI